MRLWKSAGVAVPPHASEQKIRGLVQPPNPGNTLIRTGYERVLLLTLFRLLGALLGGLLLCWHVDCHLLLADLIDSPESRVLVWPPLEGREPRVLDRKSVV